MKPLLRSFRASLLAPLAAAALTGRSPAAEPLRTATWNATVSREGARAGQFLQQARVWLADGRLRVEDRTPGLPPTDAIVGDDMVYLWEIGKTTGMKMPAALAARSGRPLHEYALRVSGLRGRGRPIRSEKRDGHACDVVGIEDTAGVQATYWLARDLSDFPIRIEIERPEAVLPYRTRATRTIRLIYENRDVKIGAKPDSQRVALPQGMAFQDASEIFTGPRKNPR